MTQRDVVHECGCDDPDTLGTDDGSGTTTCLFYAMSYPWCRSCREHHRPPECPVDEQGRALAPCGHPWDEAGRPEHTAAHPEWSEGDGA